MVAELHGRARHLLDEPDFTLPLHLVLDIGQVEQQSEQAAEAQSEQERDRQDILGWK